MWDLHGDEQQASIAKLQPCHVPEMLQRMVLHSLFLVFNFWISKKKLFWLCGLNCVFALLLVSLHLFSRIFFPVISVDSFLNSLVSS